VEAVQCMGAGSLRLVVIERITIQAVNRRASATVDECQLSW